MKHEMSAKWNGNMQFEALLDGQTILMDAPVAAGGDGAGVRPKLLLLTALAGCTGMDVTSILKKMRVPIEDCTVSVQGELSEGTPALYTKIHVIYEVKGDNLPLSKVEKAVRLSEESYCGVGLLLRRAVPITSEIRLVS